MIAHSVSNWDQNTCKEVYTYQMRRTDHYKTFLWRRQEATTASADYILYNEATAVERGYSHPNAAATVH